MATKGQYVVTDEGDGIFNIAILVLERKTKQEVAWSCNKENAEAIAKALNEANGY